MRLDVVAKHLLVVSADEDIGAWLHRLLNGDFSLSLLHTGPALLESIEQIETTIDLVLLAANPHNPHCLALLSQIHKLLDAFHIPVIVVASEEASSDRIVRALEAGARDVVSRSRGKALLIARVNAVLAESETIDSYRRRIAELTESENLRLHSLRMAAHDLKTPINNVRIAESILRLTAPKSQEVAQSLNMIRLMVANMNDIINNFVGLFEVRAGQMRIQLGPIYLPDAIDDVINDFGFSAAQKHVHLNNSVADGWVIGDLPRLKQALGNLLSNAIKYSPCDSEVKITARGRGSCVYIMLEDEGAGIPKAEREELFQVFGELSPRPSAGESSTGLGLWIVDHLMKAQNGAVGADFPEAGGSRFWVSLPKFPANDAYTVADAGELVADLPARLRTNPSVLARTHSENNSEAGG